MDIAAIPICMAGVLLIAKPSFLFGQHTDRHISHIGIIIGVAQVGNLPAAYFLLMSTCYQLSIYVHGPASKSVVLTPLWHAKLSMLARTTDPKARGICPRLAP